MAKRFPAFESYTVKNNTIDLTTLPINGENQGCLVDRKLVDLLTKQVISIPFGEAKEAIIEQLVKATTFEEMKSSFNDAIYVHEVCALITEADAVKEPIREAVATS